MNPWQVNDYAVGAQNRGPVCESGLCSLCSADCEGKCETWLSSIKGSKMLYPTHCGLVTAGSINTNSIGVSYSSIRIKGYSFGSEGFNNPSDKSENTCFFNNANTSSVFGSNKKVTSKLPIMTGALGSTTIAAKYWDSFAIGAALIGIPIVIGENVVGVDKNSIIQRNRILKAPALEKRIETYFKYYNGSGCLFVQMNVEDEKNGLAEYLIDKYGQKIILEIKWGQGAKNLGGEIKINDLETALFLQKRGYLVSPDPSLKETQEAYKHRSIKSFARHSRLKQTELSSTEEVEEYFNNKINRLRKLGFERISLKTGAYGMKSLALAIKLASQNKLDLLTIDGAGGGTGMSPWNMMQSWGIPSVFLHSKAYEYASILKTNKKNIVDLAFGGGFAKEDHIFKALALGAPFTKMVCLGRALMIPGYLGSNIQGALFPNKKELFNGNWDNLPKSIAEIGSTAEEIFAGYYDVLKLIGAGEIKNIPYGAIAMWTLAEKLKTGLQQFMAGARKFNLESIKRSDLFSANRETERETKIPFMTEAEDQEAKEILLK